VEQVSCHPFPRPVRHRALLRGRERRRGTTGPRLLPQRSARRAEGSRSGREETAREAPTLSRRTGRGTSKRSPPQADLDAGAAGATRSVARRVLRHGPTAAARRRRRRPHRSGRPGHPTRRGEPGGSGHRPRGLAVPGGGVERHEPSVTRSALARGRPSGCCGRGAVVHRDQLRRSAPMLTACSGWVEDNWRNPRSAADFQWSSGSCANTGPPTVVGLPENVLAEARAAKVCQGQRRGGQPGIGRRRTGSGPPGMGLLIRTGANPAAVPGAVHRLFRRRPRRRQMKGLHR
jgi:hypothetical protein